MAKPNPLLEAALAYAARGWPVLPCDPANKRPLNPARRENGKPVKGTGGVSAASTDAEQIRAWWKKWPLAMVGVAAGHGFFALDFDPRHDEDTGEEWTLDRLKAETEAQIGCAMPATLAARTPSGGVHLYFAIPDGEPIRNRGNLPHHVDVRGLGGYVVAPPSVTENGLQYRWLRGAADAAIEAAPATLVEVLRSRVAAPARPTEPSRPPSEAVDEAVRKYALAALDGECREVRTAGSGGRNNQLNISALKIASLVAAGALDAGVARASLEAAARDNPGRDDERQLQATIESGWTAGMSNPRDLAEVAAAARERASRPRRRSSSQAPRPDMDDHGTPSSREGGAGREGATRRGAGADRPSADDLDRRCAFFPQTDLGNKERFLARFGRDFLFVEAWGWLAWDGRRWNRDMAMALLGRAVQATVRAIQDEAELVRESGIPEPAMDLWDESQRRAHEIQQRNRLDRIVKQNARTGEITYLSDTIAKWGRTSEGAGHIGCIAKLAEADLSARTEDFDADPLALNVENGTLHFMRPENGFNAGVELRPHRREDKMTKIAAAAYLPPARSPLYDAFLAEVQPDPDMRDFLDVWAGYNALGLADAQKMAVFYGEGSNGKGVWINTTAFILGDYAWSTGIETFTDAGRYRKGSDATPDLAALSGRRMVYANETKQGGRLDDALVKELTSDEPKGGVRELMKPPFQLLITFTNTISCNHQPVIGTDHGIQRRVQIVPWDVIIPDERADIQLKSKLKEEASGILNRMVAGALRYLTTGIPKPQAVKEATEEFLDDNDILGRFLRLCVARVPGETVGATAMHKAFAGWQTWSQLLNQNGKPWSPKYLTQQLKKRKFKNGKSSSMQWQDVALRYSESDFVDYDDKPRADDLPDPRRFDNEQPAPWAPAAPEPPPRPLPSASEANPDDY